MGWWSASIRCFDQPDGSLHLCNDFQKLIKVSKFKGYTMPLMEELNEWLGSAQFISMLDLTNGYWQVPLAPTSQLKTACSTSSGHWQHQILPF